MNSYRKYLSLFASAVALMVPLSAQEIDADNSDVKTGLSSLKYGVSITGVALGSSGADLIESDNNTLEGTASFDFEASMNLSQKGSLYLLLESGAEEGLDGTIPTLTGINTDAYGDTDISITEFWYEHLLWNDKIRIRAGQLNMSSDFDTNAGANDETDQFLSGMFVNNITLEFPEKSGPGVMGWVTPVGGLSLGLGIADPTGNWYWKTDEVFIISEAGFQKKFGDREGNYRLYGWANTSNHEKIDGTDDSASNQGWGISLDQQITDNLTLLGRYGHQRDSISEVSDSISGGLQLTGTRWGREEDTVGLAVGCALLSSAWKDNEKDLGNNPKDEYIIEGYYNIRFGEHFSLTPDVQWRKNPGGDGNADDLWIFGVRSRITF